MHHFFFKFEKKGRRTTHDSKDDNSSRPINERFQLKIGFKKATLFHADKIYKNHGETFPTVGRFCEKLGEKKGKKEEAKEAKRLQGKRSLSPVGNGTQEPESAGSRSASNGAISLDCVFDSTASLNSRPAFSQPSTDHFSHFRARLTTIFFFPSAALFSDNNSTVTRQNFQTLRGGSKVVSGVNRKVLEVL